MEGHCSATVSVAQPLSVTCERFRKPQRRDCRRLLGHRVARVQAAGRNSLKSSSDLSRFRGFLINLSLFVTVYALISTSAFQHFFFFVSANNSKSSVPSTGSADGIRSHNHRGPASRECALSGCSQSVLSLVTEQRIRN